MALAAPGRPRPTRQLAHPCNAIIWALGLGSVLAPVSCRPASSGTGIDLVLPEGVGRRVEFEPRAAFAEYVELPELRQELRVTLASYDLACDHYVAPGPSDVLFVLTLTTSPKEPFAPGTVPLGPALPNDAGAVARTTAFAVARQGEQQFDYQSGGSVELRSVDLTASGRVSGVLALEFPGDGTRPAAAAHGKFEARMCHGE